MSLAGFLIGRHTSRAEIAAETPIFHALATAETPIFYALTTAHDTPDYRIAHDAEPTVPATPRAPRTNSPSASNQHHVQPARTGRHHLLLPLPA